MKNKNYWMCNDAQGLYLYVGKTEPILEDNVFNSNEDCDWINIETLDSLGILYPKDLPVGTCKQLKLKIKSKW